MTSVVYEKLLSLTPLNFERFLASVWSARGYEVALTSGSGDRGIDFSATKFGHTEFVQAKQYSGSNKITSAEVRKYATLYIQNEDVDEVVIATTGDCTSPALELASDLDISIVDRDVIESMVSATGTSDLLAQMATSSTAGWDNSVSNLSGEDLDPPLSLPDISITKDSSIIIMHKYESKMTTILQDWTTELSKTTNSEKVGAAVRFISDSETLGVESVFIDYVTLRREFIKLKQDADILIQGYKKYRRVAPSHFTQKYLKILSNLIDTLQSISENLLRRVEESDRMVNCLLAPDSKIPPGKKERLNMGGTQIDIENFDPNELTNIIDNYTTVTESLAEEINHLGQLPKSLRLARTNT